MQVTFSAVRVYGSAAYRAESAENKVPVSEQLIGNCQLGDGGDQARATVFLGAPVPWVVIGHRIRREVGRHELEWFRGVPMPHVDSIIADVLTASDSHPAWQDSWYVTLVVERDIEVPDVANADGYQWVPPDVFELMETFQHVATPVLSQLAALSSTVLVPDAFAHIILADQVYVRAPERIPLSLPTLTIRGRLQVTRTFTTDDETALATRLRAGLAHTAQELSWLQTVAPWWLAGLGEEDPYKAFTQLLTGLELLHEGLVRRYYQTVVRSDSVQNADPNQGLVPSVFASLWCRKKQENLWRLCPRSDLGARGEFAILTLALFPGQARSTSRNSAD